MAPMSSKVVMVRVSLRERCMDLFRGGFSSKNMVEAAAISEIVGSLKKGYYYLSNFQCANVFCNGCFLQRYLYIYSFECAILIHLNCILFFGRVYEVKEKGYRWNYISIQCTSV